MKTLSELDISTPNTKFFRKLEENRLVTPLKAQVRSGGDGFTKDIFRKPTAKGEKYMTLKGRKIYFHLNTFDKLCKLLKL